MLCYAPRCEWDALPNELMRLHSGITLETRERRQLSGPLQGQESRQPTQLSLFDEGPPGDKIVAGHQSSHPFGRDAAVGAQLILNGVGKIEEAIKYYLDAAGRGHAGAMNDLGGVFEYGIGVPKNLATAIVWYERAAWPSAVA